MFRQTIAVESVGLGKRYGASWAARDVALNVPAGAIYGFLGANGAGKTTTIRLMLGLLIPSAGNIRVFGHDVVCARLAASAKIGALLDARATYDHLTGRDNLDLTRRLLNLPVTAVDRALDFVSLGADSYRKVGHYSLGMRQRLGLARALLGSPRLLVLDEPMNGLDPDGMRDMRTLIRELPIRTGATVFLSSHLLSEVEQTATHIGVMREGNLVMQGPIAQLLARVPTQLIVRPTSLPDAMTCLAANGVDARISGDTLITALDGGDNAAVAINQMLIQSGVKIIESAQHRGSLASLYLQLGTQTTQKMAA